MVPTLTGLQTQTTPQPIPYSSLSTPGVPRCALRACAPRLALRPYDLVGKKESAFLLIHCDMNRDYTKLAQRVEEMFGGEVDEVELLRLAEEKERRLTRVEPLEFGGPRYREFTLGDNVSGVVRDYPWNWVHPRAVAEIEARSTERRLGASLKPRFAEPVVLFPVPLRVAIVVALGSLLLLLVAEVLFF